MSWTPAGRSGIDEVMEARSSDWSCCVYGFVLLYERQIWVWVFSFVLLLLDTGNDFLQAC